MTIIAFYRSRNVRCLIHGSLNADCVANKMLLTGKNFITFTTISPHLHRNYHSRKFARIITSAKKEESTRETNDKLADFRIIFSKRVLAQSFVAILGLGFVDAGYSGDWSRIGAISKDIEDLLKLGSFVVVPLCLYLILSLSKKVEN